MQFGMTTCGQTALNQTSTDCDGNVEAKLQQVGGDAKLAFCNLVHQTQHLSVPPGYVKMVTQRAKVVCPKVVRKLGMFGSPMRILILGTAPNFIFYQNMFLTLPNFFPTPDQFFRVVDFSFESFLVSRKIWAPPEIS